MRSFMSRLGSALILVASLQSVPARAAGPVVAPAGVGLLASPNVSLVSTIPDTGMVGGRFVGHYFVSTIASVGAFVPGPNSGIRIYDVADPEKPVLTGILPLPHGENEDVDVSVSRKFLLVSMETYTRIFGGIAASQAGIANPTPDHLYIVSMKDPAHPAVIGSLEMPTTVKLSNGKMTEGPGHIANCIDDCRRYAYVTGADDGAIYIVDLSEPTFPHFVGTIPASVNHAAKTKASNVSGYIHDVNVDRYGQVWTTGEGGTAQLDTRNPLKPKAVRWIRKADNDRLDQSIHHNSLLLDRQTLLVTEEDYLQPQCRRDKSVGDPNTFELTAGEQGSFQTWRVAKKTGEGGLTPLDQWTVELANYTGGSTAVQVECSAHWFSFNGRKVVAIGWYNQGVRFLDVSNSRDIRQVGYWIPPTTTASAAYFVPGRNDLVYVADYMRGFDILRLSDAATPAASPTVVAPIREEWLTGVEFNPLGPSRSAGYACLVPRL